MEIEAALPPTTIRFEKTYNSYALRILKFQENHLVKRAISELDDRDELGLDRLLDPKSNPIFKFISKNTSQLGDLVARIAELQKS